MRMTIGEQGSLRPAQSIGLFEYSGASAVGRFRPATPCFDKIARRSNPVQPDTNTSCSFVDKIPPKLDDNSKDHHACWVRSRGHTSTRIPANTVLLLAIVNNSLIGPRIIDSTSSAETRLPPPFVTANLLKIETP
ncbi:uncharacterized protein LOC134821685 [Bolinopsis microptera]|uniref:uncharacterized protein LOC134821685 n=1 Tax=Bolinopsis microptera TaxID=2820187 RepID=UPI003079DAE3